MKHKKLVYAFLPVVIGASLLGVSSASAHGFGFGFGLGPVQSAEEVATRHQQMFEQQAKVLGLNVDEIKAAWAAGKTMQQLMTERGISEETVTANLKAQREEMIRTQLQTLVSRGVITQAQADQRLQVMQSAISNGSGMGRMGRHHGMGFGFRL